MRETITAIVDPTIINAPTNQALSIMTTGSTAQYDRMVKPGENILSRKRKGEDVDLTSVVRELLVNAGLTPNVEQHYDTHHMIKSSLDLEPGAQLFLQNAYWRLQLMNVADENTMYERMCLQDNIDIDTWVTHFTKTLLPRIASLDLPQTLSEVRNVITAEQLRAL